MMTSVKELFFVQQANVNELIDDEKINRKYFIQNELNQKMYWAIDKYNVGSKINIIIMDKNNMEVLKLNHSLFIGSCFFRQNLQKIKVLTQPGNVIGSITQEFSLLRPIFNIKNGSNQTVMRIIGSLYAFIVGGGNVKFKVYMYFFMDPYSFYCIHFLFIYIDCFFVWQ